MSSIRKNFFYNVLLNVSNVLFPLVTAPYIARVLEPDGVGLYNFAVLYASYFALFACLGMPNYGMREIAKKRDSDTDRRDAISELFSINVMASILVSVVFVISVFTIPHLSDNMMLFLVAGFLIYLAPFKVDWYFTGMEQFKFITTRNIVVRFLTIICIFLFVKTKSDLIIYVALYVANQIGGGIWAYIMMTRRESHPRISFTSRRVLRHFKPLLILFSSSVAMSIYTMLDTVMLGFMSDYDQVGYYSSATHVSKAILMAVISLSLVVVPRISYYAENNDFDSVRDLVRKSMSVNAFLAFPVAIGLASLSPWFVPLFFGQEFMGAIVPLEIMSMVIIAIGFNNLIGLQILIGLGHDRLYLYSILFGTIPNVLLNLVLIPRLGAIGASISSVSAEILILLIMIFFVSRHTPLRLGQSWPEILKSFGVSILFVPLIYGLSRVFTGWWLIGIFVVTGAALYLILLWLIGHRAYDLVVPAIRKKFSSNK